MQHGCVLGLISNAFNNISKNGQPPTSNIQNWGLIGFLKVVARIKCRVA